MGAAMVIDCHYHLEERALTVAELLAEMNRTGVDRVALMATMVAPFREPPRFLVGVLQSLLERRLTRGLGRALVANFTAAGEVKILGTPYAIDPDPDNARVFAAVERHPQRFLGWVFVNPRGKRDMIAELEAYQGRPGFVGVKAHPFWHHFRPVELAPVAERLVALGKPLLIHAGFGPEGDFEALLDAAPGLKLVLAHAGFPGYGDTWARIRARPNVYLDLSQTSYTSERATREVVALLGPERLLFGTDGPYGFHGADGRYDYGFIKRRIERLFPDPSVRARLLGGTFAELALG